MPNPQGDSLIFDNKIDYENEQKIQKHIVDATSIAANKCYPKNAKKRAKFIEKWSLKAYTMTIDIDNPDIFIRKFQEKLDAGVQKKLEKIALKKITEAADELDTKRAKKAFEKQCDKYLKNAGTNFDKNFLLNLDIFILQKLSPELVDDYDIIYRINAAVTSVAEKCYSNNLSKKSDFEKELTLAAYQTYREDPDNFTDNFKIITDEMTENVAKEMIEQAALKYSKDIISRNKFTNLCYQYLSNPESRENDNLIFQLKNFIEQEAYNEFGPSIISEAAKQFPENSPAKKAFLVYIATRNFSEISQLEYSVQMLEDNRWTIKNLAIRHQNYKQHLLSGTLYELENETLAEKIDFAWEIYTDTNITDSDMKKQALVFLISAFDLDLDSNDHQVNERLILLMQDRESHRAINPEYIPGKSPLQINVGGIQPVYKKYSLETGALTYNNKIDEAIKQNEVLDVLPEARAKDTRNFTDYFSPEKRANYQIHIIKGTFKKGNQLFDTSTMKSHLKPGFAAFTFNLQGELSAFTHRQMTDSVAHSTMNAGSAVVTAGELEVIEGKLKSITTHSGHYNPSLFNVYRFLEHLSKNNVDISETSIYTLSDPRTALGPDFECEYDDAKNLYKFPASQIFNRFQIKLNQLVNSINKQVETHLKSDSLVTGDTNNNTDTVLLNMTKEFSIELIAFKASMTHLKPDQLEQKITELNGIIVKYEEKIARYQYDNANTSKPDLSDQFKTYRASLNAIKEGNVLEVNPTPSDDIQHLKNTY